MVATHFPSRRPGNAACGAGSIHNRRPSTSFSACSISSVDFGEKAKRSQVYAEDGNVRLRDVARG